MRLPRRKVDSELKMDSTGDIAFLLVIFFMLTAAFAAMKGLRFDLPTDEPTKATEGKNSVLIRIASDGTIDVDCRSMPPEGILSYLEPRLVRNPDKPVIVYPDERALYRSLVAVLDELAAAPQQHGFEVANLMICTPKIVEDYVAAFETDPFATHCGG